MSGPTVYKFGPQLAYSAALSDEPSWSAFYRRLWPEMIGSQRIDGANRWQRDGVDRIIYLPNRKEFYIDEKKRTKDFGDIALEDWSVFYKEGDSRNKAGWALDENKVCDFIAYAVIPSSRCYLLPYEILRQAFKANHATWVQKYRMPPTQNEGYQTLNVGVKWNVLYPAMVHQMLRQFGASHMEVPEHAKAAVVPPTQGELQLSSADIRW